MAKIITGFSSLKYKRYNESPAAIHDLAAAVDVSMSINTSEPLAYYTKDGLATTVGGGMFQSGSMTLTIDSLPTDFQLYVLGHNENSAHFYYRTTDESQFCAIGFLVRYLENSTTKYSIVVFEKVKFKDPDFSAATQSETLEFQPCTLTCEVYENSDHRWKQVTGESYETTDFDTAVSRLNTWLLGATQ